MVIKIGTGVFRIPTPGSDSVLTLEQRICLRDKEWFRIISWGINGLYFHENLRIWDLFYVQWNAKLNVYVRLLGGCSCTDFVLFLLFVLHRIVIAQMHYASVLILILQIMTRFCSTGTHIYCLSVHKRLGEEEHPSFLSQACGSRTADGKELALRSHRPPRNVPPNEGSAGRGVATRARACSPCLPWFSFDMEEIYAKFVSQKINKTRWRPVPPGSLQTAETFATGSWDNEVPPLPGQEAPASSPSPGTSPRPPDR